MKQVIAISGKMHSGKTTVSNIIKGKMVDKNVVHLPFAGPLKEFATLLGWNGKKDAKGRRLLQLLGTECGRACIDVEIWTKAWKKSFEALPDNTIVLVDDMRFQNELAVLCSLQDVIFIDVIRPSEQSFRSKWFPWTQHSSERGVIYPDSVLLHTLVNDSSFQALHDGMGYIFARLS